MAARNLAGVGRVSTGGGRVVLTLIPHLHAVPSLLATAADADVVLLDRGVGPDGGRPPSGAAGRLVIGADRLELVEERPVVATLIVHLTHRPRAGISTCPVKAGRLNRGVKESAAG